MTGLLPRRRALVVASVVALRPAAAGPALAHSDLHHSEPADRAVVRDTPPAVVLMFQMPMRVMTLRLLDEAGRERKLAREGERGARRGEAQGNDGRDDEGAPPGKKTSHVEPRVCVCGPPHRKARLKLRNGADPTRRARRGGRSGGRQQYFEM